MPSSPQPRSPPAAQPKSAARWSARQLAVAVAVLLASAVGVVLLRGSDRVPDRTALSLVVLPIVNQTGDPAIENDVDEMTERLARSLARLPGAFVIAPSTAFTFKGRAVDVRRVGSELGVRYVLEGALRRQQDTRLQLTVGMADSTSAMQLWSETFETSAKDASELRTDVATRVAGSLGLRLVRLEAQRSQRVQGQPDAAALLSRARGIALGGAR